jgi:hypothetical protein
VFYNPIGLMSNGKYTIANKERTLCDLLYVYPGISFDNLNNIDVDMLHIIANIYGNKRLVKEAGIFIKAIESRVAHSVIHSTARSDSQKYTA